MKVIKNIVIGVITSIILIIIAFNLYNFISINVLKKDLPTINGMGILEVVSGSMEPVINIGDLIVIDTKDKKYEVGKVITFYDSNGNFVTHRIIEVLDDYVITQGDANNAIDEATLKEDIVGVYQYKLEKLGIIINSFRSPFVMVMILIIGILICLLISTDKNGNVVLTDEEKEYIEFLDYKKNKEVPKKKSTSTKKNNKSTSTKKTTNKKTTTKKSSKASKEKK